MAAALFALAMIAAILLALFGIRLALSTGERWRGVLMLVAAAVLIANVAIWTV